MQRFRLRRRQNVKPAGVLSRILAQEFLCASPDAPQGERCQIPQGKSFPLLQPPSKTFFWLRAFRLNLPGQDVLALQRAAAREGSEKRHVALWAR